MCGAADTFAQMIQHATRELDASIFADEHLEKEKYGGDFPKIGGTAFKYGTFCDRRWEI